MRGSRLDYATLAAAKETQRRYTQPPPTGGTVITTSFIPRELKQAVDEIASSTGQSVSSVIRLALYNLVDEYLEQSAPTFDAGGAADWTKAANE